MLSSVVRRRLPWSCPLAACLVAALVQALLVAAAVPNAQALPPGFVQEGTAIRGLTAPTNFVFVPDGRVVVAEKRGTIQVFDGVNDSTPSLLLDMTEDVFDHSDSGLNGLALDPQFPSRPYLYVSYQYDAPPGGTAPTYNDGNCDQTTCPDGPTVGRVERLTLSGTTLTRGPVLLSDSCNSGGAHAIDDVAFGPGGVSGGLYVATGDGASAHYADYGQPDNRCGDPPGATLTATTGEGGAFHSQDARTTGDPLGLSGSMVRINPDTGEGLPANPFAGNADPNMRRLLSYGLRNPFRFDFRPGSSELYVGDVGWNSFEELNLIDTAGSSAVNYGWPCYEGPARQGAYDSLNNTLCESLYTAGSARAPFWSYRHSSEVAPGVCAPNDAGAFGPLRFYTGTAFPQQYRGALFFAEFSRGCLLAMKPGADGRPSPSTIELIHSGTGSTSGTVALRVGPDGALYALSIYNGAIYRFRYTGTTTGQPPVASATATPSSGPVGTTVRFDASTSRDPEGGALTFSWDLDGNGTYGDATGAAVSHTYRSAGRFDASVRVTDPQGLSAVAATPVTIGSATVVIEVAPGSETWATGERLTLSGSATDITGAAVPPTSLTWTVTLNHCEGSGTSETCHGHPQTGASGSTLSFLAPDHSFPSHLSISLAAQDAAGLTGTKTVRLDPQTSDLTLATSPPGLRVSFDSESITAPVTRTVIVGSTHSVTAADQTTDAGSYTFSSWSDGGAASHLVTGPSTSTTLTASFTQAPAPTDDVQDLSPACSGLTEPVGFEDLTSTPVATQEAINCLATYGITLGRGSTAYAPRDGVNRYEMALFISRSVDYLASAGEIDVVDTGQAPSAGFRDLGGVSAAARDAIDRLHDLGIVTGKTATSYDPFGSVNRRDMARFINRLQTAVVASAHEDAAYDPGRRSLTFPDVPDSLAGSQDVYGIQSAGIVQGHADGRYQPFAPVRRDHMALYLMRHLADNVEAGYVSTLADLD